VDHLHTGDYKWQDAELSPSHDYLLPTVLAELETLSRRVPQDGRRLFDLGCGNGSVADIYSRKGWDVVGVDPSSAGVSYANARYPHLMLERGSAYDDLSARHGQFAVVTSLEVIEHVYAPRDYIRTVANLLVPGGIAILSTPYHGYWKNLALAVSGKMDAHFTALWDHGHIKFWSQRTLQQLLLDAGFREIRFHRVGRIPALAKSMIAVAHK
jgi:2-polyprenyl-3-methyl-5-hydroxy-6-metoxy-1,4-benzoquinol methylase